MPDYSKSIKLKNVLHKAFDRLLTRVQRRRETSNKDFPSEVLGGSRRMSRMCSLLLLPKFLLTMCIKALISSDTSTRRCKVFTDLSRCASAATEISQAVENYESV